MEKIRKLVFLPETGTYGRLVLYLFLVRIGVKEGTLRAYDFLLPDGSFGEIDSNIRRYTEGGGVEKIRRNLTAIGFLTHRLELTDYGRRLIELMKIEYTKKDKQRAKKSARKDTPYSTQITDVLNVLPFLSANELNEILKIEPEKITLLVERWVIPNIPISKSTLYFPPSNDL